MPKAKIRPVVFLSAAQAPEAPPHQLDETELLEPTKEALRADPWWQSILARPAISLDEFRRSPGKIVSRLKAKDVVYIRYGEEGRIIIEQLDVNRDEDADALGYFASTNTKGTDVCELSELTTRLDYVLECLITSPKTYVILCDTRNQYVGLMSFVSIEGLAKEALEQSRPNSP